MAVFLVCLALFLAMTGPSSAIYCLCRDGLADSALQKNIDYACGAGADCTPILQNGACYNPNTVKAHCDWAVNSYFQRRGQAGGNCNFDGTAIQSQTPSASQTAGCVYPSSASPGGSTTNPISPPSGTSGTAVPGSNTSVFGLGPTGSGGITNTDNNSASVTTHQRINLFYAFTITLVLSGLICLRI